MVRVFIPSVLSDQAEGIESVDLEALTLGQLVGMLDQRYPGMGKRISDGDRLVGWLSFVVDGELAGRSFLTPIAADSEVHFIPAIAGGSFEHV